MTRTGRIIRNIAIGVAALIVVALVAAAVLLHTAGFQAYIRGKIITAIADGTGGRTEIGAFSLDASHLHAHIDGLVIHGREPAGAAPFAQIAHADVYLHLFGASGIVGISSLQIEQPRINVIVLPDGSTNLPIPRSTTPSKNTPLETIVDLAVGHFEIRSGALNYNSQREPLDVNVNNLHVQLWYSLLKRDYEGQISLEPVYVASMRQTPVTYRITLPLVLERDAVRIHDATIATPSSSIQIDAAMENLRQPRFSGHVSGRVALTDLRNTFGVDLDASRNDLVALDAVASTSGNMVNLQSLHVALGHSSLQANGSLKDLHSTGTFHFNGQLALAELARIARSSTRPEGDLLLNGEASLDPQTQYRVSAHIATKGLALQQGTLRIRNAAVASDVHVTPALVELSGLRVDAFGGEFDGQGKLEKFARYNLTGTLHHLDIAALNQLVGRQLPYSGTISGPIEGAGDLKTPGIRGLDGRAQLTIAPGTHGIPIQGSLQAGYSGSRNDVTLGNSYLALPHTRLTMAGSVQHGLHVSLVTHDLGDLLAATSSAGSPPVTLAGGQANLTGVVTGTLSAPQITGQLAANHFQVQGRQFDSFTADVSASSSGATVNNGALSRGTMLASFSGRVGMRDWSPEASQPLAAAVTIRNADLADLMVLAGQPNQEFSGSLVADANINGTVGDPAGSVTAHALNGTLRGEPFDKLDAQINLAGQTVTLQSASLVSGSGRADLTSTFQHPKDSFSTGHIQAHLQTNQVDLARLKTVQNQAQGSSGQVEVRADLAGDLSQEFLLTNVNADISAHSVRYAGQQYGDLQAAARTSGQIATIDANSDFAGSKIQIHATTQLVSGYPTNADAQISSLPVESALAAANRSDLPVRGKLSATAHLRNALSAPEGDGTFELTGGTVGGETVERLQGSVTYTAQRIDLSKFDVTSGPSHLSLTAQYEHPLGELATGTLQFRLSNGHLDLARSKNIQSLRPGIAGVVQMDADGSATIGGADRFLVTNLNSTVAAPNLTVNGQKLGSINATAHTASGQVTFDVKSDLAGANIQASGNGELRGNYPLNAQLTFNNVQWTRIQALLGTTPPGPASYEITADGKASFNGPALQIAQSRGSLEIDHAQVQTTPAAGQNAPHGSHPITIQNQGPIQATLDQGEVKLTNFHFAGPQTDIQASGSMATQTGVMNISVNAGVDLALLHDFSSDITSSGNIKFTATARGTPSSPQATGQLELHNANINYAGVSNGLSNANGTVLIRGNRASIQNLQGESGGGKVTLSGFATFGEVFRFAVRANATNVRVRPQGGVSVVLGAELHGTGTLQQSTTTGTVTIQQLNYSPQSDIGSMLTRSEPTVESAATPNPLLDHMKLDVHVITSPALHVQSSLSQNLQTDANLRIRGTASQPSMLGRIDLTEGQLVFFGSTYKVNSGSISFFNPVRIDPILNLSLETQSQGVDVVLNVTGHVDNMNLSYTSDPPLPFQEIIGLLSTGATPTSDPVLLANQPAAPQQSIEQRGESAVVGQAIANPVANRLQRVFGISQLKIDPAFTGSSALPTTQVTLQQKVSNQITFTYTTALDNANSTLIQAEWALNPRWSATAVRDQNGIVSINLLYKKKFR